MPITPEKQTKIVKPENYSEYVEENKHIPPKDVVRAAMNGLIEKLKRGSEDNK